MFGGQSQFKQNKMGQWDVRQNTYRHTWTVDLMGATCKDPCFCCLAAWCSPCVSYHLRKRTLYNDMTRYVCCLGDCPCSGRLSEQSCPEFCLALEVCFCFTQSVASTRWALQDEMHIQNTECDNCLIGTMIAMQYLACICDIAACLAGSQELAALSDIIDVIAHALWISVCACMQTQHKVQLDERDKNPGLVRPAVSPMQAPAPQAIPPPGHQGPFYPAGPPQGTPTGYPPQGYPQGPPQGYPQGPPQGYPQANLSGFRGYSGYPPQGPSQNMYVPQGYPQQQGMKR